MEIILNFTVSLPFSQSVFPHNPVFLHITHAFSIYFSFAEKEAQLFIRSPRLKVQRRAHSFSFSCSLSVSLFPLASCFLLVGGVFVCCSRVLVARSLIEATVLGRDISRSPP